MTRRQGIARVIDVAARAQLESAGGYRVAEREERDRARASERPSDEQFDRRVLELEGEREKLHTALLAARSDLRLVRAELRRVRNALYATRRARDRWYAAATDGRADSGRGAARGSRKPV